MKNILLISWAIILLVGINSCSKYDPIYGVATYEDVEPFILKKDFVYIYNNDIYLADEVLSNRRRLTTTPNSNKTHVAIGHKHDRVAYLNSSKQAVIIDTLGAVVEVLPYNNVKHIKWLNENGTQTLVLLVGNSLIFHNSNTSLNNVFDYVFPIDVTYMVIDAFDINSNLDVVFTFRYQNPYSPTSSLRKYYHGIGINYKSSSSLDKKYVVNDGYYNPATTFYTSLNYRYFYMTNFNTSVNSTATVGQILNLYENDYSQYDMYSYSFSSNNLSTLNVPFSSNYHEAKTLGNASSTVARITKYLVTLPAGVPASTGTANTFIIDFSNQNATLPCYFDWNP